MTIKPFSIVTSNDPVTIEVESHAFFWNGRVVLLQPRIECTGSGGGRSWFDSDVDVYLDWVLIKTPNHDDDCTSIKRGNLTEFCPSPDLEAWTDAMVGEFGVYDVGYGNNLSEEFLAVLERCLERHVAQEAA